MRESTHESGWMVSETGVVQGFCLGFDFCAEHERGVTGLLSVFGVQLPPTPIGIEARTITQVPEALQFLEYSVKPRDKRRKAFPAAMLVLEPYTTRQALSAAEIAKSLRVSFYRSETAEDGEVCVGWDHSTFAINVCGAENIARLKALHDAFQAKDIAVANPSYFGFSRQGPCFVQPSLVNEAAKQSIRDSDLAYKRLREAVDASGIEETLRTAGKRWYALSPAWDNREMEEDLVFFLNPCEQRKYHHGWFNLEELKAWAADSGPVLQDEKLVAFDKAHVDWEYNLVKGVNEKGLGIRHARLEWMDEAKTQVGVRIRPAIRCEAEFPEGLYEFNELMAKYAATAEAA